ncbi:MAG: Na+/H+ antiporter NhaA [Bacteroidales bacterium]|nr:Na+/H+ antiporter NhaA [Bacteroidales bacterium]
MIDKIIITPFQKFIKIESFSGILLFSATIIALIWANSQYSHIYESLWQYKLGINTQDFKLAKPLIFWINDGLMVIFFFLIGLEIKRELLIGELDSIKKAAFPFFSAIGGMIFPVALFIFLNKNPETSSGWGIPMAADIAFSLAILKLLGNRVPLSLTVFLTAFAIIDDIGAVLVIAIFYSSSINLLLLAYALILILILSFLSYRKIYAKYLILLFGIIIWLLFLKAGIHPTVAGVLLAFTIPIRQKIDIKTYTNKLCDIANEIKGTTDNKKYILSKKQIEHIDNLEACTDKVQSPLQLLEHRLHNWVAYFIIPIFALANAGVVFNTDMNLDYSLITNIVICLFIGNFISVTFMSFLSVKLRLTELPKGVKFRQILGIASLAGVGFTMSIFIANLAFVENTAFIDSAKVGILIGSFISGITGYTILKLSSKENETKNNK